MKTICIIDGPNLNLVGCGREPEIYGNQKIEEYINSLYPEYLQKNIALRYFQSNSEGEIIDALHDATNVHGIVLNAGAYTHTSLAIADAISAINAPVIEIHLSNIYKRNRPHSYISPVCKGTITGFGINSYKMAINWFCEN